jgi:HEAT repeat protein
VHSVAVLLLTAATVAADPAPADLVRQLGHQRFAVREAAAKKLVELGADAVPALVQGSKSADEEVRARCLALLPQAKAAHWKKLADAYLADKDGEQKHDLPLLAEWEKVTGKPDAGSRQLFAAMVRAGGELLEQVAADPKAAARPIKARCRTVLSEVRVGRGQAQLKADPGLLAALLFAHQRIPAERAEWESDDHPAHLLANPGIADGITSQDFGAVFRKVVITWVDSRAADDFIPHQCFALAVKASPFPEAVHLLNRFARDSNAQRLNVRAVAVDALGKIGSDAAKTALIELIDDKTDLFRGAGMDARLGDHALAALVTSAGKRPSDYLLSEGMTVAFRAAGHGQAVLLTIHTFPNDEARQKAVKKWKDEAAAKKER